MEIQTEEEVVERTTDQRANHPSMQAIPEGLQVTSRFGGASIDPEAPQH